MRSAFASLVVASTTALLAVGCHDRVYQFNGTIAPLTDGGGVADAGVDKPVDKASGGSGGGQAGAGGGAGTTGAGGSAGAGGGVSVCEDNAPERQTDLANCGKCFNLCIAPNSDPACTGGVCQYTCRAGFFDADGNMANGCECVKTNNGVESCDGLDNDCNGVVDDGFDFNTSLANCGGCNKPCTFPFATATCTGGVCSMGACLPDFYDRDPTVPGCETACEKTNGGVEICDGLDNDCNGVIDDNLGAPTVTCKTKGVCAGTTPTCAGDTGWVCSYPSTYQSVEDMAKGCDGLDNDCDGTVDEAYAIGKTCAVGSGPCAGTGSWVCDNTVTGGRRCNGSMKTPGVEVCNGQDDDCDGKVDELDSLSDRTADDKVVYFAAKNVTLFAYEASRYDASGASHGFDSTRRPCAVAGKQPWSNVTKEEAEAACEKVGSGWRLCTAAEWFDACNGSADTTFPYGNPYDGAKCNGYDYPKSTGTTTLGAGAASYCISDLSAAMGDELYDMSGNVKEWTLSTSATTGPYELRGGAYDIASFIDSSVSPAVMRAPGLQCDASTPAPAGAVRLPSVGFRCCKTGMLPP